MPVVRIVLPRSLADLAAERAKAAGQPVGDWAKEVVPDGRTVLASPGAACAAEARIRG
jgi:hypothetical protein